MGLRDRRWHPWSGTPTGAFERLMVIPRYGLKSLFAGRIFVTFCVLTWIVPLVFAAQIYLRHNAEALAILGLTPERLDLILPIDATFFERLLRWQIPFAFLAVVRAAPVVVVPDLRAGGLPLLLSRPLTPLMWVVGKVIAVVVVLSTVTWIPAAACLALQVSLVPSWLAKYPRVALGTPLAGLLASLWLALVAVAVAALVRSKPGATAAMFGAVFATAAVGAVVQHQLDLSIGGALQLPQAAEAVWRAILGMPPGDTPASAAFTVLILLAVGAALVLWARIRPIEVVK